MKMKKMMWLWVTLLCIVSACRNHPGENTQALFPDFLEHFASFTVPFTFNEDSLTSSVPDSTRLTYKTFSKYIPDSLWYPQGKKGGEARIYPIGKHHYGQLELLMVRSRFKNSDQVGLLVYGKADTLTSFLPLMGKSASASERSSFLLDDKYLLHLNKQKNLPSGEVIKQEDVYGLNKDGSVALILTNTNQPTSPNTYYNPIDTLPQKAHFSGDYFVSKSDIVSIRDGDDKGTFRFFIHLNKGNGDCTGELDGTAQWQSASEGVFKEEDGPCAIRFTFSKNKVTIAEVGGCGAYRGISCNFTGTYTKKATKTRK